MSNLEHYFENLLFMGKDVNGDWNKNSLTEEEQNAVEECAQYVLYTLFCGQDELKKALELCAEVVHCKECKWREEYFSCPIPYRTEDDFFCGKGERQNDSNL